MDDFHADLDEDGVLWLRGELDLAVTDRFVEAVTAALDGQREFVLDLRELTFLDSTGIRAIVEVAMRMQRGIVLRSPRPNVRRILALTSIEGLHGIRIVD